MNFGRWIVVSFVLFALFIGTLVALCIREDTSLVSKDYYKEELDYQQQIKRLNNTEQLEQKPTITFVDRIGLKVVWNKRTKIEKGELKLFCPSNAKLDRQFDLQSVNEQIFEMASLKKGMYRVKLLWSSEGKEYYYEEEIFIG
ncbi:MAG: FixH family protein [Bacteroidetes bacterium]|nr:FixH family protein [Bacteroidota bacterium]MBI3482114.1 FixH family protein [Bacteroidota bacterium]